ncbi:MAG: hypothetical protein ACKVT0_01990 [Planctomycetaceae bacterium]
MNKPSKQFDEQKLGELEHQLSEKEALVAELTAQLEQAADELDRRHRSGYDRGLTLPGSGFPPELVEQQKNVTLELQEAVQRWDDMQVSLTLGRLETQLLELRDLVASSHTSPGPVHRVVESAGAFSLAGTFSLAGKCIDASRHDSHDNAVESPSPNWEAIKSLMLVDQPGRDVTLSDAKSTAEFQTDPTLPREMAGSSNNVDSTLWSLPTPAVVEIASASIETLRQAVEERDAFIVELVRKLRSLPVAAPPQDWPALANVPDELRQQLESLVTRYEEKMRCAEIELSLERARLSREEAHVQEQKELLDKQMKRLGISSLPDHLAPEDHDTHGSGSPEPSAKSGLWKLLGK